MIIAKFARDRFVCDLSGMDIELGGKVTLLSA
jgi:hypothetical protein